MSPYNCLLCAYLLVCCRFMFWKMIVSDLTGTWFSILMQILNLLILDQSKWKDWGKDWSIEQLEVGQVLDYWFRDMRVICNANWLVILPRRVKRPILISVAVDTCQNSIESWRNSSWMKRGLSPSICYNLISYCISRSMCGGTYREPKKVSYLHKSPKWFKDICVICNSTDW